MNEVFLTKRGYERLRAEYDELSLRERPKVVNAVAIAAAEGDRSENAEYIYGKKRLREIDRRLQYLTKMLKNPKIVSRSMVKTSCVDFGSKVLVEDQDGEKKSFTVVGEGEADFKEGTISYLAPVAQALLGRKIGEIAEVLLQKGLVEFEIISLEVGDID